MSGRRKCPQCGSMRGPKAFLSSTGQVVLWCQRCRTKYKPGNYSERASEPRRGLPIYSNTLPRVSFTLKSSNKKLGEMPVALISGETCPPACSFFGRGCYHEFGLMGHHWRGVHKNGLRWDEFLEIVQRLRPGTLWRYASGGDLPGIGNDLNVRALVGLVISNEGRRGFTFTHKPMKSEAARNAVAWANAKGFTINLSADSLLEADEKAELGIAPVVVVLETNARTDLKTPAGRRVVICPYETHGITCSKCQLCSRPGRSAVIGFRAHGQMASTVSKIVSDRA